MQTWQMQDAKARLSEVVKSAQHQPQDITVHGHSVAVVVSRETFDSLSNNQVSLVDFMQRSPLFDVDELVLDRDASLTRESRETGF
jgi:prevent-host-death family protein